MLLLLLLLLQLLLLLPFAFDFPAVERAEHRSGTGGEEAHVSERSELCAVPLSREEHRGPMRRSRIGSRPGCAFFWLLFFAQAKKSDSLLRSRSESSAFKLLLGLPIMKQAAKINGSRAKAFAPLSGSELLFFARAKKR